MSVDPERGLNYCNVDIRVSSKIAIAPGFLLDIPSERALLEDPITLDQLYRVCVLRSLTFKTTSCIYTSQRVLFFYRKYSLMHSLRVLLSLVRDLYVVTM